MRLMASRPVRLRHTAIHCPAVRVATEILPWHARAPCATWLRKLQHALPVRVAAVVHGMYVAPRRVLYVRRGGRHTAVSLVTQLELPVERSRRQSAEAVECEHTVV